jgi:hypothetical protein
MSHDPHSVTLRLAAPPATPLGRLLCLREGDRLCAINGQPFAGDEKALAAQIATAGGGRPVALTFRRGAALFTVLSPTARFGLWEEVPASPEEGMTRINPAVLGNWEILADRTGCYDLHPLSAGLLALIAPPVWFLQMRLWVPAAALVAAGMVAFAVAPLMLLAVYVAAGLHVWHAGPRYFRKDRMARGMTPLAVLAAPGERAAHAALLRLEPSARFVFAPPPAPPLAQAAPAGQA